MYYITRPNDWSPWALIAINKINRTIDSCCSQEHVDVAKNMVNNFIVITALEENVNDKILEDITMLFWLRLDLQRQSIFEKNKKELV